MASVATKSIIVMIALLLIFFVHELGHYLVGRIFKLKIAEFSIGFGPVKFLPRFLDKNGTVWRIGLFPIAAYVRPLQRPTEDLGPVTEVVSKIETGFSVMINNLFRPIKKIFKPFKRISDLLSDELDNDRNVKGNRYIEDLSPIQMILLAAAGPVFNFLLSIFTLFILYNFYGRDYIELEMTQSSELFQAGDRIVKINKQRLAKLLQYRLFTEAGTAEVERNGKSLLIDISVLDRKASKFVNSNLTRLSPASAIHNSLLDVGFLVKEYLIRLINVKQSISKIGGPISVIKDGIKFTSNPYTFLAWILMISLFLGAFNLLPLPPLDGGRILSGFLELCLPKSYHESIKKIFDEIALIIVLLLFILLFKTDIIGFKK